MNVPLELLQAMEAMKPDLLNSWNPNPISMPVGRSDRCSKAAFRSEDRVIFSLSATKIKY